MAAKKGAGTKKAQGENLKSAKRDDLIRDAGGYDWGWTTVEMVMPTMELSRRLAAGGFSACGYGMIPNDLPFIALLGSNIREMKSALALMKEWTTLSGPNAIRLEIAYEGQGYMLAISSHIDLMRWRIFGVDSTREPLMMVTSHIKRMDSRHPMLDQLAEYVAQPVAPLRLLVAKAPQGAAHGSSRSYAGFTADWDNSILLPGIEIYRQPEDRPPYTMARTELELRAMAENGPDPAWPPTSDQDPAKLASTRERRLAAAMPKTLHVLRTTRRGSALLEHASALGCARWQVEQAICNLRSADFLAYQPSSAGKRLTMIDAIRHCVLEPASMTVDFTAISNDQISTQIGLDAAFLLRRLAPDLDIGSTFGERIERLRELGYG